MMQCDTGALNSFLVEDDAARCSALPYFIYAEDIWEWQNSAGDLRPVVEICFNRMQTSRAIAPPRPMTVTRLNSSKRGSPSAMSPGCSAHCCSHSGMHASDRCAAPVHAALHSRAPCHRYDMVGAHRAVLQGLWGLQHGVAGGSGVHPALLMSYAWLACNMHTMPYSKPASQGSLSLNRRQSHLPQRFFLLSTSPSKTGWGHFSP